MMYQPRKFHSPFRSVCVSQPTDIVEEMGDDGYTEEVAVPRPRKQKKYLPGERLLIKLNKQREKEREKNRVPLMDDAPSSYGGGKAPELDMGVIQTALNNIFSGF